MSGAIIIDASPAARSLEQVLEEPFAEFLARIRRMSSAVYQPATSMAVTAVQKPGRPYAQFVKRERARRVQ